MNPVLIKPRVARDTRGLFCKTWHPELLGSNGISLRIAEEFHTISDKNVIRGMHFQSPPYQHSKLVYCPVGAILDVVVDLRSASPTMGKHWAWELNERNQYMLYIPEGFAHGFLSLSKGSLVCYRCSSVHVPSHDLGILWNSFGFIWPCKTPLLSERDLAHPTMGSFQTPF